MNITIYQAAIDKQNAIMACTDEDGVIDMDKLDAIEGAFEQKAVAYIAVSKSMTYKRMALEVQRDAVMAEYEKQIKVLANNEQHLKDRLREAMKATGTKKVQSDDGLLTATLSVGCTKAVQIDDEASIGEEWRKEPKPRADMPIDKTALKLAIEAGQPVPAGVLIVHNDRFTIR